MSFTSKASCSNDPEETELQPNQSSDNKKEVPSPFKTSEHHIHIDSSQQHSNISPSEKMFIRMKMLNMKAISQVVLNFHFNSVRV